MKKIIQVLLFIVVLQQVSGQAEKFDIVRYTAPKNWKKENKTGIIIFTDVNESKGIFCMIAIYASAASSGQPAQDFTNEWNDLAVSVYGAVPAPKTEIQTSPDGWKVVAGAAPIVQDKISSYLVLTVFSGFGKKISVLSTLNDQSYLKQIDALLENIKLDKTAGPADMAQSTIPVAGNTTEAKGQLGTMLYAIPGQWNVKKYPDGDILVPADLPKNEVLEIWVQQSMNFSGTIEQALQKSYDETVVQLKAVKMHEVNGGDYSVIPARKSFRGWEYIRCSGGIKMGGGEYPPEYGLDLFLIKLNGRFERVAILKSRNNCNLSRYYPSDRLKYYYSIENFLFSLQFADWKEPIVKTGNVKGDGITAAWQGIAMSVGMSKPGAELGAEFKVKQLIFFSNGQAFFGNNFPAGGLDELNTWMSAEINRRDWGTYSFSNGKGILKLPYADIPLQLENNKLIITTNKTDHAFIKINSVDGARFNGRYALSSKSLTGEETGKTPLISFTPDGKFTDNGAMGILYHEYIDCLNTAKEPGTGTYEVKNYSVVFNYTDGRKIKIAFPGIGYDNKNPAPATLTMSANGDMLKKQ